MSSRACPMCVSSLSYDPPYISQASTAWHGTGPWWRQNKEQYFDGLAQDCCNSIANALESLQSCAKPSIWTHKRHCITLHSLPLNVNREVALVSILLQNDHKILGVYVSSAIKVGRVHSNGLVSSSFVRSVRPSHKGVGGAVRFLVVGTIGQGERPPRVSSGWSSVWHRSNTGLSSTQYEQIPIILGVWPFWLTPFFFRSITFWRAYG